MQISLAAARVNAGLTQSEVADKVQKKRQTIQMWEKGKIKIDVGNLYLLASIYGVNIDDIFLPSVSTKSRNKKQPEEKIG